MEVEVGETSECTSKVADSRMAGSDELPRVEVRFENLSVEAEISDRDNALPTLFNYTVDAAKAMIGLAKCTRKKCTVKILDGLNGIIRPSRYDWI